MSGDYQYLRLNLWLPLHKTCENTDQWKTVFWKFYAEYFLDMFFLIKNLPWNNLQLHSVDYKIHWKRGWGIFIVFSKQLAIHSLPSHSCQFCIDPKGYSETDFRIVFIICIVTNLVTRNHTLSTCHFSGTTLKTVLPRTLNFKLLIHNV